MLPPCLIRNCTLLYQCAKLRFFFELSKKKNVKSYKKDEKAKKSHKYLCISKNMCTFAALFEKSPAKSGFASAKSELSAFGLR